jgi:hypothetical protein
MFSLFVRAASLQSVGNAPRNLLKVGVMCAAPGCSFVLASCGDAVLMDVLIFS